MSNVIGCDRGAKVMAAIPDHGIKQGKRKLRLIIDQFEGAGRGNPVFSVVDAETG
jgi:hypothetical protein